MRDQAKDGKRYLDDNIMESYAYHRRGDWMYMHRSLINYFRKYPSGMDSGLIPTERHEQDAERALANPNLYAFFGNMNTPYMHTNEMQKGFY
jgi:hypothetical protein